MNLRPQLREHAPSPDPLAPVAARHRLRRLFALATGAIGVFDIVTAVLPPSRGHLILSLRYAPLVVVQSASALLALSGLVILGLSRGIRRGQRKAWLLTCVVLAGTAALHLARGVQGLQSLLSLLVLIGLLACRGAFAAATDRRSGRLSILVVLAGLVTTIGLSTASVETFLALDRDGHDYLPLHLTFAGVAERMFGIQTIAFPSRLNRFLAPSLLGIGLALAVCAALVVSRPLADRRHRNSQRSFDQARRVVGRHGGGTLDYFALRYDKRHHFSGETLITYAVHGGVCLVSPDPIGPADERADAWEQFCRFADDRGWVVAVLGADASWLPIYRRSGLRSLYIGDEAIVRLADFDLAGGHKKGLRQAVNRIIRYGYTVSFHDPRDLDETMAIALRGLMEESRRGERERGFSMTLGRVLDPEDAGLLLAVAHGSDGVPVAFCQFVPAPSIDGYSLDLMRRDQGEHPNGLIDFLIVSTIQHLSERGMTALALNFATMRALLAREAGERLGHRVLRFAFTKLSRSMQIESLWRFSAKFDPEWVGRYLVYGSLEHVVSVGMAVARAESFWELPVIGRYLDPARSGVWTRGREQGEPRAA